MSTVEDLSADEKRAYELITAQDGLLQSELWKALDADSRTGSRLAQSLAEKGLIEREETVSNGRTTYRLQPVDDDPPSAEWTGTTTTPVSEDEREEDERDAREERALSLVRERNGIYQSEFWKELDVSSRTGSRIATTLEEEGSIRREEVTHDGQRTYLLLPAAKDLDFSLLMAGDEISPFVGADEDIDPIESDDLTHWILRLAQEHR